MGIRLSCTFVIIKGFSPPKLVYHSFHYSYRSSVNRLRFPYDFSGIINSVSSAFFVDPSISFLFVAILSNKESGLIISSLYSH